MRLFADGDVRRIHFEAPNGDAAATVRAGELMFDGKVRGMRYAGTAYVYSSTCGRLGFRAEGPISSDYRRVTLLGRSPIRDGNCNVQGFVEATLIFDFKEKATSLNDDENGDERKSTPYERRLSPFQLRYEMFLAARADLT